MLYTDAVLGGLHALYHCSAGRVKYFILTQCQEGQLILVLLHSQLASIPNSPPSLLFFAPLVLLEKGKLVTETLTAEGTPV